MNREQVRDRGCPAYGVGGNLLSTRHNWSKSGKLWRILGLLRHPECTANPLNPPYQGDF